MSVFSIEALLQGIDADNPVGENLEYEPDFVEMEALATTGGTQSIIEQSGENETEAIDWHSVREKALNLLLRSKDLRLVVYLARSSLACDGLTDFADSLALMYGLLDRYWDQVHPQLDPEDDNDPTMRVNTIATLCGKEETLDLLAAAPLVASRQIGKFSYRHIQMANGELALPRQEDDLPDLALISAAFRDCELPPLEATCSAINESIQHVDAIDRFLTEKVGAAQAPDLEPLSNILNAMYRYVSGQLAARGVITEELSGGDTNEADLSVNESVQAMTGDIRTREDAVRMMDRISEYFRSHEPSSPIPLLMQRSKRLASMNFLDILKDVAPNALSQVENIVGLGAGGVEEGEQ